MVLLYYHRASDDRYDFLCAQFLLNIALLWLFFKFTYCWARSNSCFPHAFQSFAVFPFSGLLPCAFYQEWLLSTVSSTQTKFRKCYPGTLTSGTFSHCISRGNIFLSVFSLGSWSPCLLISLLILGLSTSLFLISQPRLLVLTKQELSKTPVSTTSCYTATLQKVGIWCFCSIRLL